MSFKDFQEAKKGLAFSQNLVDSMRGQNMAQQSPEMGEVTPETPQEMPQEAEQVIEEMSSETQPEVQEEVQPQMMEKTKTLLEDAIKLHQAHMDGTEPTNEESQQRLMDLIESSLKSLGDEMKQVIPEIPPVPQEEPVTPKAEEKKDTNL